MSAMREFPNLEAEMAKRGITKVDLAKLLEVRYATVIEKTTGKRRFYLNEAQKIRRRFFPDCSLEYLFEQQEKQNTA